MTGPRKATLPLLAAALCASATVSCRRQPSAAPPTATPPRPTPAAASLATTPAGSAVSQNRTYEVQDGMRALAQRRVQAAPAAPCSDRVLGHDPELSELLEQAARHFEKGRYEDALECGREAARLDAQSVAAHHFRGAALAELGRIDEARTAYARALALDPDDPEVLRSAADLHVRRLGSRDDLELALQYVQRALPRALRMHDPLLQKELYLLQGMSYDDLGRPGDALGSVSMALLYEPKDREARREKGVALFELCRFDEARADLLALSGAEPDAWAEHYLGLIAERQGDEAKAALHFARASQLDPDSFRSGASAASSADKFAQVVQEEVARLPADVRRGLDRSAFAVEDLPRESDLKTVDPPLSPGILGLFKPPPENAGRDGKASIILYRRNLARAARSEDELHREVRDTLLHEVGHLNGEDDDQLRERGL
jgi:Flp pilus assembly protein TadD/predicted Zn-dependent protease with MMP-like domain